MQESIELASVRDCRNCIATQMASEVARAEARMGLEKLTGVNMTALRGRASRVRVCQAIEEMNLSIRDAAAVADLVAKTTEANAWLGAYESPERFIHCAKIRYLSVSDCAEFLGVSLQRVRKLLSDGILTGIKTSDGWIVSKASAKARKKAVKVKPSLPKCPLKNAHQ